MAILFDVTVSGIATNSYVTVVEYNSYNEKLPVTDDLPSEDQTTAIQKLLIAATDAVNNLLYCSDGDPSVSNQRLEYPRTGLTDRRGSAIASTAIPESLKDAVCEMANFLKINNLNTVAHDGWDDNLETADIGGSIDFSYKMGTKPSELVPNRVKQLITNITGQYPTVGITIARG